MKGRFVTIEGCEGVGKSTQIRMLKEYCAEHNIDAVFTREPGGTMIAEHIRDCLLKSTGEVMNDITELLLYSASRRQHTYGLIRPALEAGKLVVCDRYIDSTLAYQGYARGIDNIIIQMLNGLSMGDTKIDLTIFIDVNPKEGFFRKGGANKADRMENETIEFHQKVYEGFCDIAYNEPERVERLNGDCTRYETHNDIINLLKKRGII